MSDEDDDFRPAAWGEVAAELGKAHRRDFEMKDFEVGGFCRACQGFVPDGFNQPGCNRDDCLMQTPHKAAVKENDDD